MLTIRKFGVVVGDAAAARRLAAYGLEREESALAFSEAVDGVDGGGSTEGTGVWLGSEAALGAVGVGRQDVVDVEGLANVLQGGDVDGRPVRRVGVVVRDGLRFRGVNNLDLTFSVPKSVSVLWSQADAGLRVELERAVMAGWEAAVGHVVGSRGVVVRRGVDGVRVREPATGFAASASLHVRARRAEGDEVGSPQLHVHGLVVGVTRADGRLVTPDSWGLYRGGAMLEGGAVGRAVLAERLVELGFAVRSGTGRGGRFFEVEGVPEALMERFSGRAREVEGAAAALEQQRGVRPVGGALAVLACETRQAKERGLDPAYVQSVWDSVAQEYEFGPERVAALRGVGGWGRPLAARRDDVWTAVRERMTATGPTITAGAFRSMVFETAAGRLSLDETRGLLEELQRSGQVLVLERDRVALGRVREIENRVMGVAASGRPAGPVSDASRLVGIGVANESLGQGRVLDGEQLAAVHQLTSGVGWSVLTGRAGTGKGPVLEAVAAAYREEGWQVVGCAMDGATTRRLGAQLKAPALTLGQVRYRLEHGTLTVDERTVVVLDEASKVGLVDWDLLADLRLRCGARVVAVGHEGQLDAIELPGLFPQMVAHPAVTTVRLEAVRRHRDPSDPTREHAWLVEHQVAVDEGRGIDAVAILRREGAIHVWDNRIDMLEGMVDDWEHWRRRWGPQESLLVVHGSNQDVDYVNALAQRRRLAAGELTGDGVAAVDRSYRLYVGDNVILRGAAYQPAEPDHQRDRPRDHPPNRALDGRCVVGPGRVENGQVGVVVGVESDADRVLVSMREPGGQERVVVFDQAAMRDDIEAARDTGRNVPRLPALRLGYAGHPFPVQGATVKATAAAGGHWSEGRQAAYVADTRSVFDHRVHINKEDLKAETSQEALERYGHQISLSQAKAASIAYNTNPQQALTPPIPQATHPWLPHHHAPERAPARAAVGASDADRRPERALANHRIPIDRDTARPAPPSHDLLVGLRDVLGRQRARELEQAARDLLPIMQRKSPDELQAELARHAQALQRLDRPAARQALRLERDIAIASTRAHTSQQLAQELTARTDEPGLTRAQRTELRQAAITHQRLATTDHTALNNLTAQHRHLHNSGRHPDHWLATNHHHAACWLAANHIHTTQHQRHTNPPEHHQQPSRERERDYDAGLEP